MVPTLDIVKMYCRTWICRPRESLLRGSHRQIGQWRSHRGILFGEPKTHEGNINTQNLKQVLTCKF